MILLTLQILVVVACIIIGTVILATGLQQAQLFYVGVGIAFYGIATAIPVIALLERLSE